MSEFEIIQQKLEEIKALTVMSSKNLITVKEAAIYTGYSEPYLRRLMNSNSFKSYRSATGKVYIRKADLDQWMMHTEVRTAAELDSQARKILSRFN